MLTTVELLMAAPPVAGTQFSVYTVRAGIFLVIVVEAMSPAVAVPAQE
jgi:hypothetical protein